MPELPEVETVVRGLRETILDKTITRVHVQAPPASIVVSRTLAPKTFASLLAGRKIQSITRRGKNILMHLSGELTLWVHLKMTGHFFYLPHTHPVHKHDLVLIDFKSTKGGDNGCHLRFNDYRRFGRLRLFPSDELDQQPGLAKLGPEPSEITSDDFVKLCKRRPRMFKPALLDQTFIAGLGNIYADESLYHARIHPRRMTNSPSPKKLIELHGHIQRLLAKAIRLMGSSVDSYVGVNGSSGSFQKYLRAYNNEGRPCGRCGGRIVREKIGSRSAHYCPRCQRL
ncbi:MAG: bifunctional DNA-formamidopyrimidine glycosylase/DNA-(apurinic or apyrimidinic site) lyase [candidate division Zixibacteria bacterium]|nr:bifunctional DNA-formamidopyrimidine glycosylase/DNA-(apurinic or apyrimidinic site) lyase [candidate division Zixibacteria bacterium]MDH3936952.1 bifunctional DNA-formamidopyrimidine glycosylase/DNA-(apurinic or apyrimidinic site) lyase [candidate division Zixibacteria bacterium]MDH4033455.1 bifunctional DNA-formamidopyrimidine glycosylase/DNA-(apurinic or apyrimidinic site) lyase [candidate division Zixibacteria bacterium]